MLRVLPLVFAATAIAATPALPAQAGRSVPSTPTVAVRVTTSGSMVRYTVNRMGRPGTPGVVRVNAGAVRCSRWTVPETVVNADTSTSTVTRYWKQCFSVGSGRATGPSREYTPAVGGVAPSQEVWTALVPDPVLQRENGVRFVTQRAAWVWLPPSYFRGVRVDLRSSSGEVRVGEATARAVKVQVSPGWGGGPVLDCTVEAQFPYERARKYWEQSSCPIWYMKSSVDEPGGVYRATATVVWEVTAVIDGELADAATVVTDGQTAFRVEELQALVTCVGGSSTSCPANRTGNSTR